MNLFLSRLLLAQAPPSARPASPHPFGHRPAASARFAASRGVRALRTPAPSPLPIPLPAPNTPGVDGSKALQALVDAAQKITDADPTTARSIHLPQGSPYNCSLVYLDGRNLTLEGDGPGTFLTSQGPPALVLGVSRLQRLGIDPARYSVPSVLGQGMVGLSTKAEAVLSVTAHPLQLGGGPVLAPDYWGGSGYTWEFVIGSGSQSWGPGWWLFGLSNGNGIVRPFSLVTGDDPVNTLRWLFRTADQSEVNYRRATIPIPGGFTPGVTHRITIQFDATTATLTVWVDGVRQVVPIDSTDRTTWKPGVPMARTDGLTPFLFGGMQQAPAPLDVHGFLVSDALVYDPTQATETRKDGKPISPSRYWDQGPNVIAYLVMSDAPNTHRMIATRAQTGAGFWVTKAGGQPSQNLSVRNLAIDCKLQQSIALGYCFGVPFVDVSAGGSGLQAIGSVPIGCTYPVTLESCNLAGYDAAYVGWEQMVHGHNTWVGMSGRDGLRCGGGVFDWDRTTFTFSLPTTECFIRKTSDPYGGSLTIRDMLVDNEGGTPSDSIISVDHSAYCPNEVLIDQVGVSTLNTSPFVRLIGRRTLAYGDTFTPAKVSITNLSCFAASTQPGLQIDGAIGSWFGSFDGSGNQVNGVVGHGENINVIPRPVMVPAQ